MSWMWFTHRFNGFYAFSFLICKMGSTALTPEQQPKARANSDTSFSCHLCSRFRSQSTGEVRRAGEPRLHPQQLEIHEGRYSSRMAHHI